MNLVVQDVEKDICVPRGDASEVGPSEEAATSESLRERPGRVEFG